MEDGYKLTGSPYKVRVAGPSPYGECVEHGGGDRGQGHGHLSFSLPAKEEIAAPGRSDQERFESLLAAQREKLAVDAVAPAPTKQPETSAYFAGLFSGMAPAPGPTVYGSPGVEACPAQLNSLKSERDALIIKVEGLRQTLPIAARFQGIAAQLKQDAGSQIQFMSKETRLSRGGGGTLFSLKDLIS
jgi:hypothetical protein